MIRVKNMTTDKHEYQGKMRELDTISQYEVQEAIEKIKKRRMKNIAIKKEMDRQIKLEHPTIARAQPYLQFIGASVAMAIFCLALWIIFKVNASSNVPV